MFKLGMAQILVEGGKPEANLDRAIARIREAAEKDCRIVVLPECMNLGWTHPSALDLAEPIPGAHADRLVEAAKECGIYVVAGLVERAGDKIYNSAVLIDPAGEILGLHRKINELDIAHDLYAIGDRLSVAQTELGTIGINICADNFGSSQALAHAQARMGAQIILSPSAWAVDADHDNESDPYGSLWRNSYGELSRLYDLTIVGVSNVGWLTAGPWDGRKTIGCSLAMGPGAQILAEGSYGEEADELVIVEVALKESVAKGTAIAGALRERGYEGEI